MKYGKIFLENFVEILTGTQMKGTRGGDGYGYGYGPNWSDCCTCCVSHFAGDETIDYWTPPELGRICGNAGSNNCIGALPKTIRVSNCSNGPEPAVSCT